MKRIAITLAFMFVAASQLVACEAGDDGDQTSNEPAPAPAPESVEWDCTCSASCDGEVEEVYFGGCGDMTDAEETIDLIVGECVTELDAEGCFDPACSCECEPTAVACS